MTRSLARTSDRTEELKASFVVSHRPSESLDTNFLDGWDESEEWLDNVSELFTSPQITQTRDS